MKTFAVAATTFAAIGHASKIFEEDLDRGYYEDSMAYYSDYGDY